MDATSKLAPSDCPDLRVRREAAFTCHVAPSVRGPKVEPSCCLGLGFASFATTMSLDVAHIGLCAKSVALHDGTGF
jgi:hypothetical protein